MVKLKNIAIDGKTIACDIYPEGSLHPGRVAVDRETKKIAEIKLPSGFEWCTSHAHHAADKLLELLQTGEIPEEKTIMWH